MPFAIVGDAFRTSYNISLDFLLPPSNSSASDGGGVFLGARAKGPVGSGTGMDGVFAAVNATGYRVGLSIFNISGSDPAGLLLQGPLPGQRERLAAGWHRLSLSVEGVRADASLDGESLFEALAVPAPHEHYTALVSQMRVPLGKGGYAAFGTVGYALAEFDNLTVGSR